MEWGNDFLLKADHPPVHLCLKHACYLLNLIDIVHKIVLAHCFWLNRISVEQPDFTTMAYAALVAGLRSCSSESLDLCHEEGQFSMLLMM